MTPRLDYRNSMLQAYSEVYTPAAIEALDVLAPLNHDRARADGKAHRAAIDPGARPAAHRLERDGRRITENLDFSRLKHGVPS